MKKIILIILVSVSLWTKAQTLLYIPDTISGSHINLMMHMDSVQFLTGKITKTFAVNATMNHKYLGPTIILNNGMNVSFDVDNEIGDTTTLHWHGLHVAATNDGGPQKIILPKTLWQPSFKVLDKAATYWYHPHMVKKTTLQLMKGAVGMIIVRDMDEAKLNLPRKYGIDDIPLIIQTQEFDSLNQISPRGMQDSVLLVNGVKANYGDSVYANLPAQVIRLRLLNAGGARNYNFGFTGNKQFKIIASDGGLLSAPVNVTRVRLTSGERVEILLDLTGMMGQNLHLISYASEIPSYVQGGPAMSMMGSLPNPLDGRDFKIIQIKVTAQTMSPVLSIPPTLVMLNPYTAMQADTTRTITMTSQSMMMKESFYFNGLMHNMKRIDYQIPLNNIEIWELINQTKIAHPFHIHDVEFYILDRNGNPPAMEERGRKDVVLVNPNETVRFITKFEDYTDTVMPYMFHCHTLMHEDDGMMGQFFVVPSTAATNTITPVTGIENNIENKLNVKAYPNPATNMLNISVNNNFGNSQPLLFNVYDVFGKEIYSSILTNSLNLVSTSSWAKGLYTIEVIQESTIIHRKIMVGD